MDSCKAAGGKCETITEGFYYMSVAWALTGLLWLVWGFRTFKHFQEIQVNDETEKENGGDVIIYFLFQLEKWRVIKSKKTDEPQEKKTEEKDIFKYFYCF